MPSRFRDWQWEIDGLAGSRAATNIRKRELIIVIASAASSGRPLAQRTVHQFFHKLDAFELQELSVRLQMTVENHAHLPRTREDLGVLDEGFIGEGIRTSRRVALDHVEGAAMKISGAVEPRLVIQSGDIDHQRLALPTAVRPAHPAIDGRLLRGIHLA